MSSFYGLILVILTFVSGVIWLIDSLTAGKQRKAALDKLLAQDPEPSKEAIEAVAREPIYVDYSRSFFPILLFIVVLRSFLYEPFQIPSASMKPTFTEGDFILVNKYNYGLRLPVTSEKFLDIGLPKRGDVAVFKAPHRPHEDFIKRVIGVPGDLVIYTADKELYILPACPKEVAQADCPEKLHIKKQLVAGPGYVDRNPETGTEYLNFEFVETIGDIEHGILNRPDRRQVNQFGFERDLKFKVPPASYFVMGDNRDNSLDSRFWPNTHFVPEENLVGQAVSIWMHLDFGLKHKYLRWVPTGIDISRIGSIQ